MSAGPIRPVQGSVAAGIALVAAVMEHAGAVPSGPWSTHADMQALVDEKGVTWFVEGDQVSRLVALSCRCEHAELTTYREGVEMGRVIASTGRLTAG